MDRRYFLKSTAAAFALPVTRKMSLSTDTVYGHNGMQYKMDSKWSKADPLRTPVNDCHEMVQDRRGKIYLLTNETRNNVLVYNTAGKLLTTWGNSFPGGHGLTLFDEFLYITDTNKHQVYKTTLDGKILLTIDAPRDSGLYQSPEKFVPTEVAVDDNGEFFVADGYGEQYILHYDASGKLKRFFGGRGEGDSKLDNAHGITIDRRSGAPTLLVTDRTRNCFKRFSMDGQLMEVIGIPGACVCRPVIKGDYLYSAVLRSPSLSVEGSGFVTILDKNNKVVSNIGGSEPVYDKAGNLTPLSQTEKIFIHPHDVCVDGDENLYVAQWASGKVYPYKFTRV